MELRGTQQGESKDVQVKILTDLDSVSDVGSEGMRGTRNDTQIPGSICGRTLTKEEAQEIERMTMIPSFGHPEPEVSRIFPVSSRENSSGAQQ